MPTYNYIRLFLSERKLPPLLQEADYDIRQITREEYLKELFKKDFKFTHNRDIFSYVFTQVEGSYVLGRIGRQRPEKVNSGPETGFELKSESFWHAANFALDISEHSDGQKLIIEDVNGVASPVALSRAITEYINNKVQDARWEITPNPILIKKDFWKIVSDYKGDIKSLEMEFVAPNIFGGHDETTAKLKKLRDENNMKKTRVTLIDEEGDLNLQTQDIEDSIDYITEGGGGVRLKDRKNKPLYDSNKKSAQKTVDVLEEDNYAFIEANKSNWLRLLKKLFVKG